MARTRPSTACVGSESACEPMLGEGESGAGTLVFAPVNRAKNGSVCDPRISAGAASLQVESVRPYKTDRETEKEETVKPGWILQLTLSCKTMVWRLQCGLMMPALRAAWPSKRAKRVDR